MKTITIKNLSKSYAGKTLFEKANFTVSTNDRLAIIGENGAGKSTLLKIIAGLDDADEGQIINERLSIAYVAQDFSGDSSLTVIEYLNKMRATPKAHLILKDFGILKSGEIETAVLSSLSGGQRRVVEIAAVLSMGPMFLCIDEPENHLDIKVRSILTELLRKYWGAVLFVSHDHYLVNQLANKIALVEDEKVTINSGLTYEDFLSQRDVHRNRAVDSYKSETKQISKLGKTVAELRRQTTFSDAKAKTYQMKKRQLEQRQEALGDRPPVESPVAKLNSLAVEQKQGKLIVSLDNIDYSYEPDKPLLKEVTLDIRFGQKICLVGRNGAGKSSLLKLLLGNLEPSVGSVRLGSAIKVEALSQHDSLLPDQTPREQLAELGIKEVEARRILAGLLFTPSQVDTVTRLLSGGQKQRLRFALMFYARPDFIVLDEPTNNLDPTTWQLFVGLVNNFSGTVLIVTHDRSFIESLSNPVVWVLAKKTVKVWWGEINQAVEQI